MSAVVALFVVFGSIIGQQESTVPNQEIVLQFTNTETSLTDAQNTIAIVEQQLQRIGIDNIQISEEEKGKLIISYYSDTDVDGIKKLLSKQKELALGFVSFDKHENPIQLPSEDNPVGYNLDVYEIQDGQHSVSNLGGKCAVELKAEHFRFINPNFYIPSDELLIGDSDQILKVNYNSQRYVAIAKDYRSHKIPEVRAGPLT